MSQRVCICSIVPFPLHARRPGFSTNQFSMPKTERGHVSRLVVEDVTEQIYVGNGVNRPNTISAAELAADLVAEWVQGHASPNLEHGKLGVWIHPGGEDLTEKDILGSGMYHQAVKNQEPVARHMISLADGYAKNPKEIGNINESHRGLAEWLGVNDRPWQTVILFGAATECPFCGHAMKSSVPKCPNCKETVRPDLLAEVEQRLGIVRTMPTPPAAPAPVATAEESEPSRGTEPPNMTAPEMDKGAAMRGRQRRPEPEPAGAVA